MALQKDLRDHPMGLQVDGAYWKVSSVSGGKEGLNIRCECYLNEEASKNVFEDQLRTVKNPDGTTEEKTVSVLLSRKKQPLDSLTQRFTPSVDEGSENFIKQAYEYLKTLPEFEGAVDC